jgi:hypothetical protein
MDGNEDEVEAVYERLNKRYNNINRVMLTVFAQLFIADLPASSSVEGSVTAEILASEPPCPYSHIRDHSSPPPTMPTNYSRLRPNCHRRDPAPHPLHSPLVPGHIAKCYGLWRIPVPRTSSLSRTRMLTSSRISNIARNNTWPFGCVENSQWRAPA